MEYKTEEDMPVSPPRGNYSLVLVEMVQEEEQQPQDPPEELAQLPMVVVEELEEMEDAKPTSIRKEFSHEPYFNFDFN
jgi:hypothetical protein